MQHCSYADIILDINQIYKKINALLNSITAV
jgi:hypothetical protein